MIFDRQNLFSDGQAITADSNSTDIIDLGKTETPINGKKALPRDLGAGGPVPLRIQVTEDFNNLTNMKVSLQISDSSSFPSTDLTTVTESESIVRASLKAGYVFPPQYIPQKVNKRYLRVRYDISGTAPTTGKITAGIVCGHQTNG